MKHQDHSVSPSGGETDVGHHRRTPEATITGDDLAEALGAQAAIITGAVDRWFEHLLQRLDPGRAMITGNDTRPPGAARTAISPAPDESRSGQAVLEGQNLAQFVLSASWSGWGHHQAASITPGGVVEIHQNNSTPGVVSPTISVPEGGLFRITIGTEGADGPAVHARIVDQDNAPLGPDFPMNSGSSEVFIFAAKRTRQMKLYLLACRPHPGARFKVNEVAVDAIAVDAYYDFQKKTGERTIASLASIPARRDILFDSVFSLLPQCDLVSVFLNGYPDIPDFLHHPRIRIRRSQDWDDRGDAGKFSWIGVPDGDGYRVIADDDLIYPVDFVPSMIRVVEKHEKRAIAGAHGVLLKQPVTAYYEMDSRYVFHFESQLRQERTVHVLGTNAVCYHSSLVPMRWADFMFPNMADIFLARFAQEHGIPMVAVMRPRSWIRQNTPQGAFDTIYEHSLKRTGTGFDTSWIQDALVKAMSPLTLQPTSRPKVIQVLIASDKTGFENLAESWGFTRSLDIDWSIIAVAATDDPDLLSCLANWRTDHEVHLVNTTGETPAQRMTTMIHLAGRIGGAMMVIATSGVRFAASGWTAAGLSLLKRQEAGVLLVGGSGSHRSSDALPPMACLLDPARLRTAGRLAPQSPSLASCLFTWLDSLGDARISVDEELRSLLSTVGNGLHAGTPDVEPQLFEMTPRSLPAAPPISMPAVAINGFFERVLVINLDRRSDRLEQVMRRLRKADIEAERVAAVDGRAPEILAEYDMYCRTPLAASPDVRPIRSSRDFYLDYDSQAARVAYSEEKAKAIRSAGAWGYLKTWQFILERALRERWQSLLVFDDDVVLHKSASTLFAAAIGGLPQDWLLLQLGTLQYDWDAEWLNWHTRFLYSTNGVAIGSHAVGLRLDIVPFLLDQVRRMEMPFDTGALSAACHAFQGRCFVTAPNIAIQSIQDSDINTSGFQKEKDIKNVASTYRWKISDYAFPESAKINQ